MDMAIYSLITMILYEERRIMTKIVDMGRINEGDDTGP